MASPIGIPRAAWVSWNGNFEDRIGRDPQALPGGQWGNDRQLNASMAAVEYAPNMTGKRMVGVFVSHTAAAFSRSQVERGDLMVIGCAPAGSEAEADNLGLTISGEMFSEIPVNGIPRLAVAMPIGALGLRLWAGRLHSPAEDPTIVRAPGMGLDAAGGVVDFSPEPLPGIRYDDLPRLCPGMVVVELPRTMWH